MEKQILKKRKIMAALLLLSSFFGYLAWSGQKGMFIFEMEKQILWGLFDSPSDYIHPFILLPLFGQICIMTYIIHPKPKSLWLWLGLAGIGLLMFFLFFIGLIGQQWKIWLGAAPFVTFSILTMYYFNKTKIKNGE